jgi:CcmD family protein
MSQPSIAIPSYSEADAAAAIQVAQQEDVYGETWGQTEIPRAEPVGLERYMVEQDKLYVVVAVVLIIWLGLAFFLLRTDRRIARLEDRLDQQADSGRTT